MWVMLGLVVLMVLLQRWLRGAFFRRPVSGVSARGREIVCPVDGTIVYARDIPPGPIYGVKLGVSLYSGSVDEDSVHVGVYMTPFDRHFVIAPCDGVVESIERWSAGVNLPMLDLLEYVRVSFLRRFDGWLDRHLTGWLTTNERVVISLRRQIGWVRLILIGDKYVNKIEIFMREGSTIGAGDSLAFIGRGSQVDLVVPLRSVRLLGGAVIGRGVFAGDKRILEWRNGQ